MLLGYAALVALAWLAMNWWPILLTFGARIAGGWFRMSLVHTQHMGLPGNIRDYRLNTRTIHLNPVLRFLYWNMSYNIEHHICPTVPFHQLTKLHALIKEQTPPAYSGLPAVWTERNTEETMNGLLVPDLPSQEEPPALQ